MEDAVQALMIAFGALTFVIGFSIAMYMFSQVTSTAELLTFYNDPTAYYDNIRLTDDNTASDEDIKTGKSRVVNADTIIPTLYRYADEEFCVKIYDEGNNLIQVFDLDLEGKIQLASSDTKATESSTDAKQKENYALKKIYYDSSKPYFMYGVPWLDSNTSEVNSIKKRIDFFVNGDAGYIGEHYVDYTNNKFHQALSEDKTFKETFISYIWSGETLTTDDGDTLVTGNAPKDKIVIIYKIL